MTSDGNLSKSDRNLLRDISSAAFSNPFSDARVKMIMRIVGVSRFKSGDELRTLLTEKVADLVLRLGKQGRVNIGDFGEGERVDIAYALYAHVYLQFYDRLTAFVTIQAEDDEPVAAGFADDALAMLSSYGFGGKRGAHALEMFYQFRRAYYFLQQGLIGTSASMKALREYLWNNVFTHDIRWYDEGFWNRMDDFSTLILGDTGTGKGTAAMAIGRSGHIPYDRNKRRFAESFNRSFISINLSQYPEALIESELFGHRKGSFTGAIDDHEGILARCSPHGAIFLDEIGELSQPVQIKLLQVLQERKFTPVGSHDQLSFKGRVIAATNRPIKALRESEDFRDDFYYRLCSNVIVVPSLRQRIQEDSAELDVLLEALMQRLAGDASSSLLDMVRSALAKGVPKDYAWPGNVRELEQAVRRIILTGNYEGDIRAVAVDRKQVFLSAIDAGSLDAQELTAGYVGLLYERHPNYEEVGRRTGLDRRTVKKYVLMSQAEA